MDRFCRWETETLSEFVGNGKAVNGLTDWLESLKMHKENTKRGALLVGPPGTGKNLAADLLFAEGGLDAIKSNCGDVRTHKLFKEKLENASSNSNVSMALGSSKSFGMIIDDVELFTPRNGLTDLVHLLNPLRGKRSLKQVEKEWYKNYWPIPVICITSCKVDDAKLSDLKKDCELIVFEPIEDREIWRTMQTIACRERFLLDEELLGVIGGDFRKMLQVASDLKMGIPIETVVANHTRKLTYTTSKENTLKVFNHKNLTVHQSYELFERDRNQLPLMIYENYPSKIRSIEDAQEVLENLCIADSLDSNDQQLDTAEGVAKIHALLTIYCCNRVFSRCKEKLRAPKPTTTFSKTSAMHVTTKKIASILNNSAFVNMRLEDLGVLLSVKDLCSEQLSHEVGISRGDLDKLSAKMPAIMRAPHRSLII